MNIIPEERILSALILEDEDGNKGEIYSGLTQMITTGTCWFLVKHVDGTIMRVTIKQEEIMLESEDD